MRWHEFFCNACQRAFSKTLIAAEYEEGGTLCPNCGSEDIEERPTAFYPINYKGSS